MATFFVCFCFLFFVFGLELKSKMPLYAVLVITPLTTLYIFINTLIAPNG